MKNHPTKEQWMEYLYGEMEVPERKSLETHIKDCAPCRGKRGEFSGTMDSLDAWRVELPEEHSLTRARNRFQPVVKWAAAAALLVSTAYATARFARPEVDVAALQAEIKTQIRQSETPLQERMEAEIRVASEKAVVAARETLEMEIALRIQEISLGAQAEAVLAARQQMEQLSATLATLREEDRQRVNAALKSFETQWLTEYRKMREDLERVAVFSDESYRKAQRQLVQLASYSEPQVETNENEN